MKGFKYNILLISLFVSCVSCDKMISKTEYDSLCNQYDQKYNEIQSINSECQVLDAKIKELQSKIEDLESKEERLNIKINNAIESSDVCQEYFNEVHYDRVVYNYDTGRRMIEDVRDNVWEISGNYSMMNYDVYFDF